MSSIDRSNDDGVRKTREHYSQKESEATKNHKKEVKRLTEAHQEEIAKLKAEHDKEMSGLRGKSVEAVSRRDMKYQKEIESLRSLHQQQLKKLAQESEAKANALAETSSAEMERNNLINEQQKNQAVSELQKELKESQEKSSQLRNDTRSSQANALETQRNRLNKAHDQEMDAVISDRNSELTRKENDFTNYRKEAERKLDKSEDRRTRTEERVTKLMHDTLAEESASHQLHQDLQREAFAAEVKASKQKYQKAIDKNNNNMEKARTNLEDTVNKRLDDKVEVLESRVHRLSNEKNLDRIATEQRAKRDLENVKSTYQKNFDLVEDQKKQFVEDMKETAAKDLKNVNKKNEEILNRQVTFFQDKMAMDEIRNETKFGEQKLAAQRETSAKESSANKRYNQMKTVKEIEAEKLRSYFDSTASMMKANFEDSLRELRVQNKKEQDQIFLSANQKSAETEKMFQQRLSDVTNTYEQKIGELEAKHQAEMRELQQQSERRLKEQTKRDQSEIATQTAQLNYRLAKQSESHQRELEELRRSHKEALANVTKTKQG